MDWLRSCYSTKMRFREGGPETNVRWYFAPPAAQLFNHHHRFGSLNWSRGSRAENVIGEVIGAPRPYDKGAAPTAVRGTNFCGSAEWYLNGAPASAPNTNVGPNGIPACCDQPPPPPCQPWRQNDPVGARLAGPGQPPLKPLLITPNGFYQWGKPGQTFEIGVRAERTGTPCLENNAIRVYVYSTNFTPERHWDCTLVSYNQGTHTGTWQVPVGAPWFANQQITIIFP